MRWFLIISCLLLTVLPTHAASPEFTIPVMASQPVAIVQIQSDDKNADTIITVENRSSKEVKDVWLVLAGHNCNSKPIWPGGHYDDRDKKASTNRPPIGPGARAQIRFSGEIVRNVELSAVNTCGKKLPSEITVTEVDFTDGSSWKWGDVIRRGEHAVE